MSSEDSTKQNQIAAASGHIDQLSENLRAMHMHAGVELPDDMAARAPSIYVGREGCRPLIQHLVRDIVPLLAQVGLYRRGKDVGTVNEETGEFELIDPHAFCTWVPSRGIFLHCGAKTDPETGRPRLVESQLSVEQARLILASQELRAKLPELHYVNLVPMPVFRKELDERGLPKMELLQPGYDEQTKTFTVHGAPNIESDWDGMDAANWLFKLFRTFDWSDKDARGYSNRMAVHISLGVTVFCRYLFSGKSPLFLYNSNLEGSGKTVLVIISLLPVFRRAGTDTIDTSDKKELVNILNTKASSGALYLWGDEMPQGTEIRDLNIARWATAETWEFRPMGQNREICKADISKCVTVFTGNRLTVDRNLHRRTLHADLFPRQTANERKLPEGTTLIDARFFKNEDNLNKILQAYWAMLKLWDEMGRPGPKKDRLLESFESWSEIVPGIIEACNLGRPLVPFEAPGAADDDTRQMKLLTKAIIDDYCARSYEDGRTEHLDVVVVTMRDIVRTARMNSLFEDRLGNLDELVRDLDGSKKWTWKKPIYVDPDTGLEEEMPLDDAEKRRQAAEYLDEKMGSSWGKFFRKQAVAGQWFTGSEGVTYQFGDRTGRTGGSRFRLQRVVQPK